MEDQLLIVGAGPTGLVTALWLAHLGVSCRIIDKSSGPGLTSRAMAVHARSLEFYQQVGIADEVIAKGIVIDNINYRKNGNLIASIDFSRFGKKASQFPFILSFPQDDHEKLLIAQLEKLNIFVERDTELVSFNQDKNQVIATVKKGDRIETISASYLLGCDGARSTVRSELGINFAGGTYSQLYFVADVMAQGDIVNNGIQLCMGDNDFLLVFPIRSSGSIRLIGIVPKEMTNKSSIEFFDIEPYIKKMAQMTISSVNWFSTYHSHHRVADSFRSNRAFLLGDAGHIHSPVGGQGMNTGIGDAVNLAWKIAAVLQNRASESILNSYEIERMEFAHKLIKTTDKMFQAVTNEGLFGKFVRNVFFPYVLPFMMRFGKVKSFVFNTVSQIKINYHNSPLSQGTAGKIKSGDRLPWVSNNSINNYNSLTLLDWQLHVYGKMTAEFKQFTQQQNIKSYEFAWEENLNKLGFEKNAIYLIRPDGYIAYADTVQNYQELHLFLEVNKIISR